MKTASADRRTKVYFWLPESLAVKLRFVIFSELENRVPYGALSGFIEAAVRARLEDMPVEQKREQVQQEMENG